MIFVGKQGLNCVLLCFTEEQIDKSSVATSTSAATTTATSTSAATTTATSTSAATVTTTVTASPAQAARVLPASKPKATASPALAAKVPPVPPAAAPASLPTDTSALPKTTQRMVAYVDNNNTVSALGVPLTWRTYLHGNPIPKGSVFAEEEDININYFVEEEDININYFAEEEDININYSSDEIIIISDDEDEDCNGTIKKCQVPNCRHCAVSVKLHSGGLAALA
ncbi:hypothetical protein ACROYT_G015003 [Oculina patagonica]